VAKEAPADLVEGDVVAGDVHEGELVDVEGPPRSVRWSASTSSAVLRPIHAIGWPRIRWTALVGYLGVLVAIVLTEGVPTGRGAIGVIMMSGLAISRLGRGWRQLGRMVVDWLPFTAVLQFYDHTRGLADGLGIPLHEADILHAEQWLFGGVEPSLWLQQHLYSPTHVYWYDAVVTLIYTTHFLATPILAAVLWLRDRRLWMRYISRVILLSVAGLITYVLFPEAPPWLAARDGLTPGVDRLSPRGWIWLHAEDMDDLLGQAQNDGANPVAAMPSLHVAFAALVAIFVATRIRSKWRRLAYLYPVAMGFTLVYTGEHYVLDLVVGVAYAVAAHLVMNRWEARRGRRAVVPVPDAGPDHADDLDEQGAATWR
jgi:membrane-associated phospholipid phosphatase